MNLTETYPASVHQELFGVMQLQRAIDKGKAKAHGNIGEYHYDCPLDKQVFAFLGIDQQALLNVITAGNDAEIKAFVKPFIDKKSADEIAKFNAEFRKAGPESGSDGEQYFLELRGQVAPDRTDVTSWADLLDLDEKRPVPARVAA